MQHHAWLNAQNDIQPILVPGTGRLLLFADSYNRYNFTERLGRIIEETNTGCYTLALNPDI